MRFIWYFLSIALLLVAGCNGNNSSKQIIPTVEVSTSSIMTSPTPSSSSIHVIEKTPVASQPLSSTDVKSYSDDEILSFVLKYSGLNETTIKLNDWPETDEIEQLKNPIFFVIVERRPDSNSDEVGQRDYYSVYFGQNYGDHIARYLRIFVKYDLSEIVLSEAGYFDEQTQVIRPLSEDIVDPIEYRVQEKINDKMPEFSFSIFGQTVQSYQHGADAAQHYLEGGVNKVNKIVIQCNPLSYRQELLFEETETPNIAEVTYGFDLSDWNFDGYLDISLWKSEGGTSLNAPHYYWLWDNQKNKYVENNDLEDISETTYLEIKDEEQELFASIREPTGYYGEYYVWQNGKVVLARTEDGKFEGPSDTIHIIVKERIDGVMKVTKDYFED